MIILPADTLEEEGQNHFLELSKLAEKDPEFYKYLQENDKELLEFDPNTLSGDSDAEDNDGDVDMENEVPVLTKGQLQTWKKVLLQVPSRNHFWYSTTELPIAELFACLKEVANCF